jgi:hypothetical protein
MDTYFALRTVHLIAGWLAVALAILTVATVVRPAWTRRAARWWAPALRAALGIQLIVGLLLYLSYSPFTAGVRANVDIVLRDPTLRYWNVIHPVAGVLSCACLTWPHIRRKYLGRSDHPTRVHILVLVIGLVLMLASVSRPT